MEKIDQASKRARGRPKNFDRAAALHQAMELFWERGYEGTSFDELIAAMGISPSSFYNAFGSKERLYKEATEAYLAVSREWFVGELGGRHRRKNRLPPIVDRRRARVHAKRTANGVHDLTRRHAASSGARAVA